VARTAQKPVETDLEMMDAQNSTYFNLDANAPSNVFSLDEAGGGQAESRVLLGEEAMVYLGLPNRPLNHLQRGDFGLIYDRFKPLFQRWERKAKATRKTINPDLAFWKNIKIRVYNKANLAQLSPNGVVGKVTAGCPTLGIQGAEYTGDLMDGRSLSTFLSEVENSNRWREYFVVVESITLTEDMQNA
jgi:hypothetical protein